MQVRDAGTRMPRSTMIRTTALAASRVPEARRAPADGPARDVCRDVSGEGGAVSAAFGDGLRLPPPAASEPPACDEGGGAGMAAELMDEANDAVADETVTCV